MLGISLESICTRMYIFSIFEYGEVFFWSVPLASEVIFYLGIAYFLGSWVLRFMNSLSTTTGLVADAIEF